MMRSYTILPMFMLTLLLVTRSASSQGSAPCSQLEISQNLDYCGAALILGAPLVPPLGVCCATVKMNKMQCICEGVTETFSQTYDVNKLPKLSQACGDILAPGSSCGGK
ncbi:unnamed protein product [Microthlaspi erraticum]|uniref:Bifunctional inhibitor/plant lipid transfer protein/seed storage helical domain-containing protein n=1 Tax=Microthlaspi erraticum TaxID=1685480 RepID=A0A6D2HH14_9BRAS|nr:unnamed protein product [Microthlaspi erraticum]